MFCILSLCESIVKRRQKVMSLFLETRMKMSMEEMVSTFRIVAKAAAGPSEPRVTCA